MIGLASCASIGYGEEIPLDERIEQRTIGIEAASRSDLFVRANSWAVDAFVSADSVIEFSDADAGLMKGKYVTYYQEGLYNVRVRATLTIELKDGAARVTIDNPMSQVVGDSLNGAYPDPRPYAPLDKREAYHLVQPSFLDLIESFEHSIRSSNSF